MAQEYSAALQTTVQQMSQEGTLLNIDNITGIFEGHERECPSEPNSFQSSIYISMASSGDESSEAGDFPLLQETFKGSYNGLQEEAFCDPQYRTVQQATFLSVGFRRILGHGRGLEQVLKTYRVNVTSTCQRCNPHNATLFDPPSEPSRPRRLLRSTLARRLQEVDEQCFCSATALDQGPSQDVFLNAYSETVTKLAEAGALSAFSGVGEVSEVSGFQCGEDVNSFSSSLTVGFVADPTLVTKQEVNLLEDTFETSYNNLQIDSYCDEFVRRISSATLKLVSSRRRRLDQVVSSYRVQVNATCRRCENINVTLFEPRRPGETRRLVESSLVESNQSRRSLLEIPPSSGMCFCTSQTLNAGFQAPMQDAFLAVYSSNVETLVEEGLLTNIQGVGDVQEVREFDCGNEIGSFTSTTFMNFGGDPSKVTSDEIRALENTFTGSYNVSRNISCNNFSDGHLIANMSLTLGV
jgi:hypothetical protein